MSKIEIFDPALCCSTGVCKSNADPELLRIKAVIDNLIKHGVEVQRYNLATDPKAFMQYEEIGSELYQHGEEVLPITVVDGKIIKTRSYPTNEEFAAFSGISLEDIKPATRVKVNKCGSNGCC